MVFILYRPATHNCSSTIKKADIDWCELLDWELLPKGSNYL